MLIRCLLTMFFCASFGLSLMAQAPPAEAINRTKRAVALLKANFNNYATAFCIDAENGLFATCEHATRKTVGKSLLILRAGEPEQFELPYDILYEDPEADVAIIQAGDATKLVALSLGTSESLVETQSLIACGFPFGADLALPGGEYPSLSFSTVRTSSIRRAGDKIVRIQLDGAINPGHSGGPVMDDAGRVVGIVNSGIKSSGLSFAIPIDLLKKSLAKPLVKVVKPTGVSDFSRIGVKCHIVNLGQPPEGTHFVADITSGEYLLGSTILKPQDGLHVGSISVSRPSPIFTRIRFSKGSIEAEVRDITWLVNQQEIKLSELEYIGFAPMNTVRFLDGRTIGGVLHSKHETIEVRLGSKWYTFPLDTVHSISALPATSPSSVFLRVSRKQGEASEVLVTKELQVNSQLFRE